MSSLFASLGIARQALVAQQYGLDVTQNNVANVNTPGYTRQRANLIPGDAWEVSQYQSGSGVRLGSIDSYRSALLDHSVNAELQRQSEYSASSTTLQQVEAIFNETGGSGLQSAITAFFNSFSALANTPEDANLRQQVLAAGEQLSSQFRSSYEQLQSTQTLQNNAVVETVGEINAVATNIARLNVEIAAARTGNTNESSLRDQRQQQLDQLAGLTDITYFETDTGSITVMSRQGALLVVGDQASAWNANTTTSDGLREVQAGGVDITSSIQSGTLGGLLKVRDTNIAGYLATLDDIASAIVTKVNAQHKLGADLNGAQGGDFFNPLVPVVPGSTRGAARDMTVAITDPSKIAAADATGGPGSNANARLLAAIPDAPLMNGNTTSINDTYSNLIFQIGLDTKSATDSLDTQQSFVTELQNQRDAASGVSLDDEAVNIIRYQKAFEANARFITIIDTLTGELIQMLGA